MILHNHKKFYQKQHGNDVGQNGNLPGLAAEYLHHRTIVLSLVYGKAALFPHGVGAYLEFKVGVGIGFFLQGKLPPLGIQRLEAVAEHGFPQNAPVDQLLFGEAGGVVGMG